MLRLDSEESRVLHLWFETDPSCQSALRGKSDRWHRLVVLEDDHGLASSVFSVVQDDWAFVKILSSAGLSSIFVIAGSPCVGFSRAKKNGKGIDDPESEKMWIVPSLISHLQSNLPGTPIGFILENVVMKDPASKASVSSTLQVEPTLTEADRFCPCNRSRLIWSNARSDMSRAVEISSISAIDQPSNCSVDLNVLVLFFGLLMLEDPMSSRRLSLECPYQLMILLVLSFVEIYQSRIRLTSSLDLPA